MKTGEIVTSKHILRRKAPLLLLAVIIFSSLASCSSRIGWGVVLWTIKGTTAKAGSIVPVYLKSNITKVFVIGLEEGTKERVEVPLWQIELYGSRGAAAKRVAGMADLASLYMIAARDGLPVREKPTNLGKRMYRLRDSEMVKVLRRVEGEALYTGSEKLPGDWYEVLTMDGTRGYVFSYAMRMFDENSGNSPDQKIAQTDSSAVNTIFSRTWRPAWYSAMIDEGMVDLDYFSLRFGLFGDAINKQIRVELPAVSKVFQYSGITQEGDWILFGSTDLRIKLESDRSLLAAWGPVGDGLPEDSAGWKAGDAFMRFIVVDKDIREAIRSEEARRSDASRRFFAAAAAASGKGDGSGILKFSSPSAGSLELWPTGLYSWKDTLFLPAGFPPSADDSAPEQKGTIGFGLRLSDELAKSWQGGFSLYPDATGRRSDYVYRLEDKRLVVARGLLASPGLAVSDIDNKLGTATFDILGNP